MNFFDSIVEDNVSATSSQNNDPSWLKEYRMKSFSIFLHLLVHSQKLCYSGKRCSQRYGILSVNNKLKLLISLWQRKSRSLPRLNFRKNNVLNIIDILVYDYRSLILHLAFMWVATSLGLKSIFEPQKGHLILSSMSKNFLHLKHLCSITSPFQFFKVIYTL